MTADSDWVAAHRVDGKPEHGYLVACQSCNLKARGSTADEAPALPDDRLAAPVRHSSPMRII